jgi:very-short-patch-repair endonuclease
MRTNARVMRRNPTQAERKVWWWLRDRQIGHKFRRQVPLGPYILDFYCAELKLAVELDGPQHGLIEVYDYDNARTLYLRDQGIEVCRVPNTLTDKSGEAGIAWIKDAIAQRAADQRD